MFIRGGRGIQIDDEGGFLASLHTVLPSDLKKILQAWSNEKISDVTLKKYLCIDSSCFVFFGLWQSVPLCDIFRDSRYRDIGLPVLFYIYNEPNLDLKPGGDPVSAESEEWYATQLELAFRRVFDHGFNGEKEFMYRLDDGAKRVIKDFKNFVIHELSSNNSLLKNDIIGKLDVHAVRLAMMIHPMECNDCFNFEISGSLMHRACCLSLFFADQHANILKDEKFDKMLKLAMPLIEELAQWQEMRGGDEWLPTEEVRKSLCFTKSKFDMIMIWFERNGWIKRAIKRKNRLIPGDIDVIKWDLMVDFKNLLQ